MRLFGVRRVFFVWGQARLLSSLVGQRKKQDAPDPKEQDAPDPKEQTVGALSAGGSGTGTGL